MKTILLLSGRGGQAKTSIAYATAHIADTLNLKVSLLDLDTNQSLYLRIVKERLEFEEAGIIENKINYNYGHLNFSEKEVEDESLVYNKVAEFAEGSDLLVIDTYGHLSKIHKKLLPFVDTVIIPTVPERSAFRSAHHAFALVNSSINELISENKDISEEDIPIILMARVRWKAKAKVLRDYEKEMNENSIDQGYIVLTSSTTEFPAQYRNADDLGMPITELPSVLSGKEFESADKAAYQMMLMAKEILRSTGFNVRRGQ